MRENSPGSNKPIIDVSGIDITDSKFDQMFSATISMIETMAFSNDEKELAPVIFVHHRDIEDNGQLSDVGVSVFYIGGGFNEHDEKHKIMTNIGVECYKNKLIPVALFLASEAWMSNQTKIQPRDDPDRKEVIIVAGKMFGPETQDSRIVTIPMTRNSDGKMIRNGENIVGDKAKSALLETIEYAYIGEFAKWAKEHKPELFNKTEPRK